MTFERSTDYELIRLIITHPRIWPHVGDDNAGSPEDFQPIEHSSVWYVVVRDLDELMGCWILVPENSICYDLHTCLLPNAWGPKATRAARELLSWVWTNTPARRLITRVPATNRLALRYAKRAGMLEYGLNPLSWLKGGILHDQALLGMSRPEILCP